MYFNIPVTNMVFSESRHLCNFETGLGNNLLAKGSRWFWQSTIKQHSAAGD